MLVSLWERYWTPHKWGFTTIRPAFTPVTWITVFLVPHILIVLVLTCVGFDDSPSSFGSRTLRWTTTPFLVYGLFWLNTHSKIDVPLNEVGTGILTAWFILRTVDLFILDPEYPRRVLPPIAALQDSDSSALRPPNTSVNTALNKRLLEPVPPAFTVERFLWAFDLWGSWRGIGWNYQAPLSRAASQEPFLRTTSRKTFLLDRLKQIACVLLVTDLYSTIMDDEPRTRAFFSGLDGVSPLLSEQNLFWKALWSILVVTMTWQSLEVPYLLMSLGFVGIGGSLFGFTGKYVEPWGWPPLMGNFRELWEHPGISTVWARTWHGYFRRALYSAGWVGLGERVLGLPSSTIAPPPSTASTPGRSDSPTPTTPPIVSTFSPPIARRSTHQLLSNLIKSLLVFFLTGLLHEAGNYSTDPRPTGKHSYIRNLPRPLGPTTFFFVSQSGAIAVEAVVKSLWRQWKVSKGKKSEDFDPTSLVTFERSVGFVWTWVWLGWSAEWVVEEWSKNGMYRHQQFPVSLIRGVWKGQWVVPPR